MDYPYIVSNNKIEPILQKIRAASRPEKFTYELLKKWGFTASNDRAMVRVLKSLGFLHGTGAPTESYDRLRDPNDAAFVLAERMRATYGELFSIDENIQSASDSDIKGALARVTGKDEALVGRYLSTFKALAAAADFDGSAKRKKKTPETENEGHEPTPPDSNKKPNEFDQKQLRTSLHYNIQIHLPATTDVAVYNAVFKSMKEHLG